MAKRRKSDRIRDNLERAISLRPKNIFSLILHLPNFARLYWSLFWDRRAPVLPKVVLVLAVIYFLSPLDLVPDFTIPGLGYIDDLAVLVLALKYFIRAMPQDLLSVKVDAIDRKSGS